MNEARERGRALGRSVFPSRLPTRAGAPLVPTILNGGGWPAMGNALLFIGYLFGYGTVVTVAVGLVVTVALALPMIIGTVAFWIWRALQ